jgi:alpha-glucosidase (family GH31 glycosyl hydrolase)
MLDIFHSNMEFDGLWNDMNEASNFCTGECGYAPVDLNLPYTPGGDDLNYRTIDLSSTHYNNISEYDVHNMYGFLMAKASASYIVERMQKRPVVISRSSFPGHGKYASRWLGDNGSTWDWMRWSIGSTFSFQMFGIPLIGSDICGFNYNTTAELCTRWYQLGTLYPFARTHNSIEAIDQEPWSFGDQLLRVANKSIRLRYSLIHFIYSEVFKLSLTGGTYFKPTFFNYPKDTLLWEAYAEDNFMLSDKLLVHPVLESGVDHRLAYFPDDLWYNFYTGASLSLPENRVIDLSAGIEDPVNIHIRGGSIIPLADHADTAKTIEQLRSTPLTLLIALDKHGQAHGDLVVDDGISPDTLEKSAFKLLQFEHSEASPSHGKLRIVPSGEFTAKEGEYESISRIVIYGCNKAPASSSAGGKVQKFSETCLFEMNGVRLDGETVIDLFYKD